jgi:Tfp pilus assembly protein PilW
MAMWRACRQQSGTTLVEIVIGLAVSAVLIAGVLTLMQQTQKSYLHSSVTIDLQQNVRVAMDRMTRVIQAAGVNPDNQTWGGATENDSAFTAFRQAGRNCIRVYADLNGDGNLNVGGQAEEADENIFFFWSTTSPSPLFEQRGTQAGQPDFGQPWVADSGGQQELARDIATNPTGTAMFRYFTGVNDPLGAPNTELIPPAASTTTCNSLNAAARQRIARVVVTLTGRATIGTPATSGFEVMNKTMTSDARARNVP